MSPSPYQGRSLPQCSIQTLNESIFHPVQPVGIYTKKYEWASRLPTNDNGNVLHLDLHPPPPVQVGGDCSLWIRSATLDFDDGLWECQVTASDFTTQDALTSQPVRLVVRGKCPDSCMSCLVCA